ncbi:vera protein [Hypoxylon argillaceum]|nr:vera protein [Hypoxylon argillaceum]
MFILLFYVILAFTSYRVARFLYRGYRCRSTIRSLKNQNIPIASHSILFGHLHIFAEFKRQHPPDVNIYVFHTWLVQNFTKFFPGETRPPPVVYLDLWPVQGIYTLVYDASAAAQFTQVESLPKYSALTQYLIPLTSNNDILSTDGDEWKTWRTRFNPSFSSRNITALLPDLIEEVMVFVDGLKQAAGPQRKWGDVIQLEKKTTNLSFDIIARATINMRLHEQSRDEPSPLQHAFYEQMQAMGQMTNPVGRLLLKLSPWHRARVSRNNRIIQDALEPQILKRLNLEQDESNISRAQTLVDVALAPTTNTKENTELPQFPGDSFVNTLISNLKSFVFAGHDTMASTICFMVKCLEDNPVCLVKLRKEHDDVLGNNVHSAARMLENSPYILNSLPYTLAVIKETLRIYPLASTMRQGRRDFFLTVPGSSVQYPTNDVGLWLSVHGLHTSLDYWPEPSRFLPERWLVEAGHPLRPVQDAWVPFSAGPRHCIGMELALTQLKLVSVFTARMFDIEQAWDDWDKQCGKKATPSHVVNGERLYPVGQGAVHPKDGMPVHVRLRV